MATKFSGVGVALVTPFGQDGAVDYEALGRLVDKVVDGGVDYIVALGTTAETPTLNAAEQHAVADFIVAANASRVPLVIGIGGNDTRSVCEKLKEWDLSAFDAVLSVVPYYNKPSQEGMYRHFMAVADASPVPIILYNVPGRTGVNMLAETTLRIARDSDNIAGIKEASGDISQIRAITEAAPQDFAVVSGDDAMTLQLISQGGHGVISVAANAFPEAMSAMTRTALNESVAKAFAHWEDLEEICRMLFEEGNPTGIKAALKIKGVCSCNVRLPLVAASDKLFEQMRRQIEDNSL